MSRLLIKSKRYEEAEKWATKAIELKELFTFYDTRGQVHKIKLRNMQKDCNIQEKLSPSLEIARKATRDFQAAEKNFQLLKKAHWATAKQLQDDALGWERQPLFVF